MYCTVYCTVYCNVYMPTYVCPNAQPKNQGKAVNILERTVLESSCIPVHTAYSVGMYASGGKEVEKGVEVGVDAGKS